MYITQPINRAEPVVQETGCPPQCPPALYANINFLGLIFGLSCLATYFIKKRFLTPARSNRKKLAVKILYWIKWILLALFILYFIQIEYQQPEGVCLIEGIMLRFGLLPDLLHPLLIWH